MTMAESGQTPVDAQKVIEILARRLASEIISNAMQEAALSEARQGDDGS